jgi:hypothetical protein
MGVALLTALNCNADVKADEQIMAPTGWLAAAVSAHGVHVAVLAMKGSRNVVLIDGVEGPKFDQLIERGQPSNLPPTPYLQVAIWPPKSGPITFSDDGAHCAYLAKIGSEYIAVLDGKEIARGPFGSGESQSEVSFSPRGKHVFYIEFHFSSSSADRASGYRVMMDGKHEPWSSQAPHVVFSADGEHYAYVGPQADAAKTRWNVVDGRQVKYFGDNLQFTTADHLVSVLNEGGLDTLVVDNKPVMRATKVGPVWVSPTGNQIAAVMLSRPGAPTFLTMNGKPIPGTEGLRVKNVFFSPDGKRYAAHCQTSTFTEFMLIDGKKGQEYQGILLDMPGTTGRPTFTADSSKFVYTALNTSKWFVVVNEEESGGLAQLPEPVIGGNARIAYVTGDGTGRKFDTVVDGKVLSPSRTRALDAFAFSASGARYAFVGGVLGSSQISLVVDGAEVPGVSVTEVDRAHQKEFPYFLFSPDDKHIAYFARDGLWIDRKLVFRTGGVDRLQFTADGQHLLWVDRSISGANTLYVDGQPSVQFRASAFDSLLEAREIASNGILTLLTVKDGALLRYRVTPPSDTSLATWAADTMAPAEAKVATSNPRPMENPTPSQSRSPVAASAQVDACSGKPRCYSAGPFIAEVMGMTPSQTPDGFIGNHVLQVNLRFRNLTNQPLILAYVAGSGVITDINNGKRYDEQRQGFTNAAKGIGTVDRDKADPQFVLSSGASSNASFVLARRHAANDPRDPIGTAFNFDLSIAQLEVLPGQQIHTVREYAVTFPNLTATGGRAANVLNQILQGLVKK